MKKIVQIFVVFCLIFTSCSKDDLDKTEDDLKVLDASVGVYNETQLRNAVNNANPGDIITINGTIYLTQQLQLLRNGTSSGKINLTGGTLDCSNISSGWGVKVNGSYWNISNMTIRYAPDCGIVFQHGGYNWVYNVTTHGNGDSGLQIYNGSHHNSINNSYSYDNYDPNNGGENADGYACKLSAGPGNQFNNCTATHNSDDGWDLYGQPYSVSIKNCNAYNNGYGVNGDGNGFKLGSANQNVSHTVTNCWAQNNLAYGYDGNGNTGHMNISGSGGTGNQKGLFARIY
ncbi:right-handed parallel beta-helix repeat-containing protein [Zunongwangia sp. HGR-M22]|uniref:right-handed parallel beta-helix repeat-containing protein n=1 Tax=Zunongwangia sp. HGR-M22 TaxID=3015168 RepID=UPI0022DD5BE5|nr:right-handed parallel beta-helix repeat-containing protein [Zunongwangia sp. HGR-M22]WBL26918.1 right-handed parallel beta-helix repeat-containing protein [Zunongwangia sp. HGR-M22]